MTPASVLIVGASLAGVRCAAALRRAGFSGSVTLVGAESHLPYDRPPLSKQFLSGEWESDRLALVKPEKLDELQAEFRLGVAATSLDVDSKEVVLSDGSTASADVIVIATGARPRTLPGTENLEGVYLLRTIDDAVALRGQLAGGPKRVVVIGAGFIGAEVAATAKQAGHDVSIVEAGPVAMLRGLGYEIGGVCGSLLTDEGIDLRLNTGVSSISGKGNRNSVQLSDSSSLEADVVVVGIGVVPNTEWLEGSGLTLDNGVVCDEFCRAADGIYAAGDVARWPNNAFGGEFMRVEHWENAVEQGGYVAKHIAGVLDEPFAPIPWFWSDQFSNKLQLAGRPGPAHDVEIVAGSTNEAKFAALFRSGGIVTGVFGLNMPREVMQRRTQVGTRVEPSVADQIKTLRLVRDEMIANDEPIMEIDKQIEELEQALS